MLRHVALVAALAGMARIPAGSYKPLYGSESHVAAFALDREPATRGEFLAFVRANPEWQRDRVPDALAEGGYLGEWRGPLDAGDGAELRLPVASVSWNAASAYCARRGKRLPTTAEWEYAAAASETRRDAASDPAFARRLLSIYTSRPARALRPVGSGFTNVYGVRDLHELVWEWTADGVEHAAHTQHAATQHDLTCAGAALGAADPSNYPAFLRQAVRNGLSHRSTLRTLGVRCAASL